MQQSKQTTLQKTYDVLLLDFDQTLTKTHTCGALNFLRANHGVYRADTFARENAPLALNVACGDPVRLFHFLYSQVVERGKCVAIVTMSDKRFEKPRSAQLCTEKLREQYESIGGRRMVLRWLVAIAEMARAAGDDNGAKQDDKNSVENENKKQQKEEAETIDTIDTVDTKDAKEKQKQIEEAGKQQRREQQLQENHLHGDRNRNYDAIEDVARLFKSGRFEIFAQYNESTKHWHFEEALRYFYGASNSSSSGSSSNDQKKQRAVLYCDDNILLLRDAEQFTADRVDIALTTVHCPQGLTLEMIEALETM